MGDTVFPFWEIAVAPVIRATRARRVVEVGALRGETTEQMLDGLGSEVELHVIDPLPLFDPAEHEQRFPGRYFFHRDISHNVLPGLPPVDVALIDGDHNWYTVFHELEMLSRTAREAGEALPVLILHDVGWPYGRRDLYYEPSRIPEEFRQPYRRAGMDPNLKKLWDVGGMNATLNNAEMPGGRRNGVMTALDDFMDGYDRPLRRLVLPFYFGLAIVAEEERIASTPELAAVLDHLASAEGRQELLELSEKIRIDATVREQNWTRVMQDQIDRGAERYLDVVAAALLDEHYLDNELRLEYLGNLLVRRPGRPGRAARSGPPAVGPLRLVASGPHRRPLDRRQEQPGVLPVHRHGTGPAAATSAARSTRSWPTTSAATWPSAGSAVGGGAIFMRAYLEAHEIADRAGLGGRPVRGLRARSARRARRSGREGGPLPRQPAPGARRLRPVRPARRAGPLRPGPSGGRAVRCAHRRPGAAAPRRGAGSGRWARSLERLLPARRPRRGGHRRGRRPIRRSTRRWTRPASDSASPPPLDRVDWNSVSWRVPDTGVAIG